MNFETLDYRVEDNVAWITLNRPSHQNSVNSVMSRELPLMWQYFNEDADAVVAVLTASGDKYFCVGADLQDLPETDGENNTGTLESIRWSSHQNGIWKPVICAVNGMAIGGGLHFVADSDIVIAAEHASFFDTHVKVGLVAGLEPVSLCRRMPMEAVLKMALTGGTERYSAEQACRWGLVGEVVAADQLLVRARELADSIKQHSPSALQRTKKAIWQAQEMNLQDGLENAWQLIMDQNSHPDVQEGAQAFLARRKPAWKKHQEQ